MIGPPSAKTARASSTPWSRPSSSAKESSKRARPTDYFRAESLRRVMHAPTAENSILHPNAALFSTNSPLGACQTCSGFGEVLELDEELIVPDRARSLRDGAVDPLSKPSYKDWEKEMLRAMDKRGVPVYTRYKDLKAAQRTLLWEGDGDFPGIRGYFDQLNPGNTSCTCASLSAATRACAPAPNAGVHALPKLRSVSA